MTEHEAAALAQRLARMWATQEKVVWTLEKNFIDLSLRVEPDVQFWCEGTRDEFPRVALTLIRGAEQTRTGWLFCRSGVGKVRARHYRIYGPKEPFNEFADKWLPFFQRSCWLSGCAVEASSHEKAEWMQEFTKEEIEGWQLKM